MTRDEFKIRLVKIISNGPENVIDDILDLIDERKEDMLVNICNEIYEKAKDAFYMKGTDSYNERCGMTIAHDIVYKRTNKYIKEEIDRKETFTKIQNY